MTARHGSAERDVFIDTVRVVAVLVVVFGHWLTTNVIWETGRIEVENALSVIRQSHPATWLIQVMPLMFFVGGLANARSLDRHRGVYLAYLRTRYERLLLPTLVFIAVWLAVGLAAEALPLPDPNIVDRAADQAALPFWFLGLYVIVVALAPPMRVLHERFGWGVVAVLAAGAALVDVLHHGFDVPHIGVLNYVFVWLLPHQMGILYADGRFDGWGQRELVGVTAGGLAGVMLLTTVGGYPVSMVGVPGDERWNTNPPSLALVMLTFWLIGLVLLLRPLLTADRIRSWVTRLNRVVLTLFLWHVSALSVAAAIIYPLGFPRPDTGAASWWGWRPVWLAALVFPLVALVMAFRRFEVHPEPRAFGATAGRTVRHVGAGLAVVSLGLGVLGFGVTGFNRVTDALGEGVLGFELNPLQNVVHLLLGLALLAAVFTPDARVMPATGGVALLYCALGLLGFSDGIEVLGMNPAMAVLHLVVGGVGLALTAGAGAVDRGAGRSVRTRQ